ncbi:MAG TPA: hypothetical protein EYN79_03115 [Planctomycetes bacterium]|nr:hypothetical protein [Planctomycetota bacterium]
MRDQVLQLALLFSVTIHLGGLLLLPVPGSARESQATSVEISFSESVPLPRPQAPPPETPPPAPAGESLPQQFPDVTSQPPLPPPPPLHVPGPAPPAPEVPPLAEEEVDRAAVASLIEATQRVLDAEMQEDRYLMLEVREQLRTAFAPLHPGEALVGSTGNQFLFLIALRIDSEGYIFDLSLRFAPGPRLDARQIEFAVASLSPLAPPPSTLDPPFEVELKVGFLE